MKVQISKRDVFNTTRKIVDLGNSFEAQFLLHPYQADFYNAGEQWNYDVYDINGKRFLYGDRTPDPWHKNYSTEIMKKYAGEARKLDVTDKEYRAKHDRLMELFCESIDRGIHDPAPVTSFANFKRQLSEQHDMFPNKSLSQIGKELLEEVPYGKKSGEIKEKINAGLKKLMEKNAGMMSRAREGKEMDAVLFLAVVEHNKKNLDARQQREKEAMERGM